MPRDGMDNIDAHLVGGYGDRVWRCFECGAYDEEVAPDAELVHLCERCAQEERDERAR